MRTERRLLALVGVLAVACILIASPAAFAQDSSVGTYGGSGGESQAQIEETAGLTATSDPGALPFTGLDLALIAGGGLLLLGTGVLVARATSERL